MSDTTQPQGAHEPPAVPFELDTYPFTLLRVGDNAATFGQDEARRLQLEHVAYVKSLQRAGHVLAAGAFAGHASLTGMGFWTPGTPPDEIRRLLDEDPAIKARIDAYELITFFCPKGAIAFPRVGH